MAGEWYMKSAFLLQHLHVVAEGDESIKVIGLYASRQDALLAIDRLVTQPGFSDHPELIDPLESGFVSGFYLDEYEVGKDHWAEGFMTV